MSDVRHLARDRCYDEWSTWCGSDEGHNHAVEPRDATCLDCLSAARAYGDECVTRKCEILDAQSRERMVTP